MAGIIRTLKGHTEMVSTLAFSPDGKTVVSGSDDDTLRIWDTNIGTMLRQLSGHNNDVKSVVFSVDGKMLASGSKDASVRLWGCGDRTFSTDTSWPTLGGSKRSRFRRTLRPSSAGRAVRLFFGIGKNSRKRRNNRRKRMQRDSGGILLTLSSLFGLPS